MEKQFNREDRLMKKLLNEAGTQRPSADFKRHIMKTIETRNAEIRPYEPLISKSGWIIIAAIFTLVMTGLTYLYSGMSISYNLNFEFSHLMDFPKISLSRNMQYSIAFVALFFLQVPFLKRLLDREYQI